MLPKATEAAKVISRKLWAKSGLRTRKLLLSPCLARDGARGEEGEMAAEGLGDCWSTCLREPVGQRDSVALPSISPPEEGWRLSNSHNSVSGVEPVWPENLGRCLS